MTSFSGFVAACGLLLVAGPAFAQQTQPAPQIQRLPQTQILKRPPLTAQQTPPVAQPAPSGSVTVAANAGWIDTGVKVQKGGQVDIAVRGVWSTVAKAASVTAAVRDTTTGPDGYPNSAGPGTLLPSANRGALIGRIGGGAPFLIGARFTGVAPADGALFVSVNDAPNEIRDNQGTMSVIARAAAAPPQRDTAPTTPPQTQAPTPGVPPMRDPVIPPTREPPTRTPPTEPPPTTRPLQAEAAPPLPPPPDLADQNVPVATEEPATAPPADTMPAPQDVALPVEPAPPPATPAIPIVPIAIGAAVLAGVLLLGSLLRPRRKPGGDQDRKAAAGAKVATRIVNDGVAGQSLTITERQS